MEVWNEWQEENILEVQGDLSDAYLANVNLTGIDLTKSDLTRADLTSAELTGAALTQADFTGANLTGIDLTKADLTGANLSGTNLSGANLSETNLSGANLSGAELRSANLAGACFEKAYLYETTFSNVDLSSAKGLDGCMHHGPSSIDHRTLMKSGKLPLPFLRGCGLLDTFIEYLPSLTTVSPIQFYSCFISYSAKDQEFAERLHADLQNKGVRCWFAPEDIKGGEKVIDQIDNAIRLHDKLLLILSPHSMESQWVITELHRTLESEKQQSKRKLFPLGLVEYAAIKKWKCFDSDTGRDLAKDIREYHVPDFSNWKNHDAYKAAFDRLLRDLKESASA